jgi:Ni/Co efflux regulator RcnB
MKKIIGILVAATVSAMSLAAADAKEANLEDVVGKLILSSSGSSLGNMLLSVGVVTKGRSTVELQFISMALAWSSRDVTPITDSNETGKINDITRVMINCRDKRYTPQPAEENSYSRKEYLAGKKYAWGDYSKEDLLSNVRQDQKSSMTKLFADACAYTGG